jgi:tRNA(Arg) A34 adenosine deaminase TadA
MTPELLARLLDVVEQDIVPLTRAGVEVGNKVFGAAILRSSDLSLIVAATNEETDSPLWHGEMVAIRQFSALPIGQRPMPGECILLSTHEPCPMCLAAIAWSGFPTIYYLFGYEQTRDAFHIPHDLEILSQVFRCDDGDYARENRYFQSHDIATYIDRCPAPKRASLFDQIERLREIYSDLSATYQANKATNTIPLA